MRLKLAEIQELNKKVQKLRAKAELGKSLKNTNRVLLYQKLAFLYEIF